MLLKYETINKSPRSAEIHIGVDVPIHHLQLEMCGRVVDHDLSISDPPGPTDGRIQIQQDLAGDQLVGWIAADEPAIPSAQFLITATGQPPTLAHEEIAPYPIGVEIAQEAGIVI